MGKPALQEFIKDAIGEPELPCHPPFYIGVRRFDGTLQEFQAGKARRVNQTIVVSKEDLEYAKIEGSKITKPIWPEIIRKALQDIAGQFSALNKDKLLVGNDLKEGRLDTFDCNERASDKLTGSGKDIQNKRNKRQYLCIISDRITRLTGVSLRSTPKLNQGNVEKDTGNITGILEKADGGLTVVFDKWSPKYIVKDITSIHVGKDYPLTGFEAIYLDIVKHGASEQMNYDLKNFWTGRFTYQQIISDDDDRDVHLIYPWPDKKGAKEE